ncbi:hypothetical protein C8R45DRAFT_941099 [Mycena sanguinolenta]|nr:hypothetical protein C8R45DRAFT_941099 [Mycena sanguinolenta]
MFLPHGMLLLLRNWPTCFRDVEAVRKNPSSSNFIKRLKVTRMVSEQDSNATFLSRSLFAFDGDTTVQKYARPGHAVIATFHNTASLCALPLPLPLPLRPRTVTSARASQQSQLLRLAFMVYPFSLFFLLHGRHRSMRTNPIVRSPFFVSTSLFQPDARVAAVRCNLINVLILHPATAIVLLYPTLPYIWGAKELKFFVALRRSFMSVAIDLDTPHSTVPSFGAELVMFVDFNHLLYTFIPVITLGTKIEQPHIFLLPGLRSGIRTLFAANHIIFTTNFKVKSTRRHSHACQAGSHRICRPSSSVRKRLDALGAFKVD